MFLFLIFSFFLELLVDCLKKKILYTISYDFLNAKNF